MIINIINNSKGEFMREKMVLPGIKYRYLGEKRRVDLINLVINQGMTIRRASKKLKINESTSKSIIKLFRETGTYSNRPRITRSGKMQVKLEAASSADGLSKQSPESNQYNQIQRVPASTMDPPDAIHSFLNLYFQFPTFSQVSSQQLQAQQLFLKSYTLFLQAMKLIQVDPPSNVHHKNDFLVKKQEFQQTRH